MIHLPTLGTGTDNYHLDYNCQDQSSRLDTVNVTKSRNSKDISTFSLTCGQDLSGGNMFNITAFTFEACLLACTTYNYDPDRNNKVIGPPAPGSCLAVVFNPGTFFSAFLSRAGRGPAGGRAWRVLTPDAKISAPA